MLKFGVVLVWELIFVENSKEVIEEVVCFEKFGTCEAHGFRSKCVEICQVGYQLCLNVSFSLFHLVFSVLCNLYIVIGSLRVDVDQESLVELATNLPKLAETLFQRYVFYHNREYAAADLLEQLLF